MTHQSKDREVLIFGMTITKAVGCVALIGFVVSVAIAVAIRIPG